MMLRFTYTLLTGIFFIYGLFAQERNVKYYIDQALTNSPLLIDYQNQILSNRIDSMRIGAGLGPQVNFISNNIYAPTINGWGYDEVITDQSNIGAMVSVSKELKSRANRQNQYEALQWQNRSITNSRKISEQDLIKSVIEQYITTYGLWQQFLNDNDIIGMLRKEDIILRKLTEKGVYLQTEYLTFLGTVQQKELELLQTKIQYKSSFFALNYLCGISDTAVLHLSEPDIEMAFIPKPEKSVFYQQFITDSLKLVTVDKQIDFEYQPKASVSIDAGYLSSFLVQPEKNFGASIGLNFSVPIYDGHQRKMQHDKIRIAEQTLLNYSEFYKIQYQQQIRQLMEQLEGNRLVEEQTANQIRYAQSLINANHKLIETGEVRISDYILAINNLMTLKGMLVQNNLDKYRIINQINYWSRQK